MLPTVTALVWAAYAWYEYLMHTRVLCSGECNIRVDLLLIYPILLVLSVWAPVSAFRRKREQAAGSARGGWRSPHARSS